MDDSLMAIVVLAFVVWEFVQLVTPDTRRPSRRAGKRNEALPTRVIVDRQD
ncbi:MAG TPA: hypothetical protein VE616_21435 [Candidatus Udaeobacter sp.]|nr:hypothetical protein [Candidatus Udaeobacter sp.]